MELPVALVIHDTLNTMSRDLQSQLRKQLYNFEQADTVLKGLGVRISRKNQPKQKGKVNNKPPQGQEHPAEEVLASQQEDQEPSQPNKRARTDAQASEAEPIHAAAQAADAAADAQAESILHVPTASTLPLGLANPNPTTSSQTPADSALESLPPAPLSGPKADAPASQTSLAAAAAAAMGGPSVTDAPSSAAPATDSSSAPLLASASQAPAASQSQPASGTPHDGVAPSVQAAEMSDRHPMIRINNFSSDRGISASNGSGGSSAQHAAREPAKLYDVNR